MLSRFGKMFAKRIIAILFAVRAILASCPDGFEFVEGDGAEKCLQKPRRVMHSWIQAADFCHRQRGHLVEIKTEQEQNLLKTYIVDELSELIATYKNEIPATFFS